MYPNFRDSLGHPQNQFQSLITLALSINRTNIISIQLHPSQTRAIFHFVSISHVLVTLPCSKTLKNLNQKRKLKTKFHPSVFRK